MSSFDGTELEGTSGLIYNYILTNAKAQKDKVGGDFHFGVALGNIVRKVINTNTTISKEDDETIMTEVVYGLNLLKTMALVEIFGNKVDALIKIPNGKWQDI